MRAFSDYLNTPEIADEPLYLREIHAARLKIYDERKGMSGKEFADSLNVRYADILKKHGPRYSIKDKEAAPGNAEEPVKEVLP